MFNGDEGIIEEPGLRPDIGESGGDGTDEIPCYCSGRGCEKAVADCLVRFFGRSIVESVWGIRRGVEWDEVLTSTISVVIMNGHVRSVDGKLFKVWATMAVELSIQV